MGWQVGSGKLGGRVQDGAGEEGFLQGVPVMGSKSVGGVMPRGRPELGEERPTLIRVSFLADEATLESLQLLQGQLPEEIKQRKSAAIRGAILSAARDIRSRR